jgi:hypothetical protein
MAKQDLSSLSDIKEELREQQSSIRGTRLKEITIQQLTKQLEELKE